MESSILMAIVGVISLLAVLTSVVPIRQWLKARSCGAHVSLSDLIGMRFRRVPPEVIVDARIRAVTAGLQISVQDLETHYLAGGNVDKVVNALISADKAGIALDFKRAVAADLACDQAEPDPTQ